jgi:hypothetical protein
MSTLDALLAGNVRLRAVSTALIAIEREKHLLTFPAQRLALVGGVCLDVDALDTSPVPGGLEIGDE